MITDKSLDAAEKAFFVVETASDVDIRKRLKKAIMAYLETPSGINSHNTPINYNEAKCLLLRMEYDTVIIVATKDGNIIGTSYGKTNHGCKEAAGMLESIVDGIERGDI